jgi:arginine utilization protein RocB
MEISKLKQDLKQGFNNTASKFVSRLFEARDNAHVEHLKTKSFAAHSALNEFYNDILDQVDSFIESYQGKHGIVNIEINKVSYTDFLSYLTDFAKYIEKSRSMFEDEFLKNQVDEIAKTCYSTIYKLTYLK